jgi:flavin-dependent dehydrogenase
VIAPRYDVAVVGGGPGGATAAAFLSRAGLSVACFERERFPRFHVGESLLPANMPLFDRLGVQSRLQAAGFLEKYGAFFRDEVEERELLLNFRTGPTWANHAYNVPRADFDRILLEHAAKEGAHVFEGATVGAVTLERERVRFEVAANGGGATPVEAAFLVDASGRDTLVASRLGQRTHMPTLGKVALFAHYRDAARWTGRLEGHIQIYIFEHGWFWYIPFAGDTVSVGAVLHQRTVRARPGSSEALYEAMIAACPTVAAHLRGATRATAVHTAANFSYRAEPAIGDRFVAVGDAVTFVDPIFSAGVYIAMQSAELASRVIVDSLRQGDLRAARFAPYQRQIGAGTGLFFHFIDQYYDPSFLDVFFMATPPSTLRDAVTTVLAGGAFLGRPAWLRARLAAVRLRVRYIRAQRRRAGLPLESRHPW